VILIQQSCGGDQHPGSAGAALCRPVREEGLLQACAGRRLLQPFYGRDVVPCDLSAATRQAQTGSPSKRTVQAPQSPASHPTLSRSPQFFAQHAREALRWRTRHNYNCVIDGKCDSPRVDVCLQLACRSPFRPPPRRHRVPVERGSEASRRYSAEARTSSIGEVALDVRSNAWRPVRRARSAHQFAFPMKSAAARPLSRNYATRAAATLPASTRMTTATIEIEMTRYRRAPNFKNVERACSNVRGTKPQSTSSS